MKKPWGHSGHPWLLNPLSGLDLWMTFTKIVIIKVKIKHSYFPSFVSIIKHNGGDLSRGI
jgi:hypothetical protein